MAKLLIINASYKSNGVSSQVASLLKDHLLQKGAEFELINLKDKNLLYCTNCRTCTQVQSSKPQMCILEDDFNAIVKQLESAQRFIFITPTNFYSVTALFKTFQERLIAYAYFPWGAQAPKYRKTKRTKKALLISSSAAPTPIARIFFYTFGQLKLTAKVLGANVIKTINIGMSTKEKSYTLTKNEQNSLHLALDKLLQ